MANLTFSWPWAGVLFLLLIPMYLLGRRRFIDENLLITPIAPLLKKVSQNHQANSWPKKIDWIAMAFFSLLVAAIMRPQLVQKEIEISRDGRSIMLVLDISESMHTADMTIKRNQASRIDVAKDVMESFINKRSQDRMGLVVFGSESFLHAPLTFDHQTIKQFLKDAQIGFAGPKTAIGDAIGLSVKKLIAQTKGDRLMVLLTDGQSNAGALKPMEAATVAKKHGVKIYIVGLGSSRAVVDGFFGPTAVNPSLSLDQAEPELSQIAELSGGQYLRARDREALERVYQKIDELEPFESDPMVLIPKKELFYWPLSLAVLLWIAKVLARQAMRVMPVLIRRQHVHSEAK